MARLDKLHKLPSDDCWVSVSSVIVLSIELSLLTLSQPFL